MSRLYIFADEAGDFAFKRGPNVSRYFIVCTVTSQSCAASEEINELRRQLAWEGHRLGDYFHATTDVQAVRDRMFALICKHDFEIQATIMEKSKAFERVRSTNHRFYQHGWLYHFKYGMAKHILPDQEIMITAASVGTKKGQVDFTDAVNDVLRQTIRRQLWKTAFWPCATDPMLQMTDYCTWAIQRKWERNDTRSYDLISDRITYEFDLWAKGSIHHY